MKTIRIERLDIVCTGIDETTARRSSRLLGTAIGQKISTGSVAERPAPRAPTAQSLADHVADQVARTVRAQLTRQAKER